MIKCNLAVLLAERGLKMSDVIKDTKLAKNTVRSLYYNEAKGVQFNTLETLCDYLSVDIDDLLEKVNFNTSVIDIKEVSKELYKISISTESNIESFNDEIILRVNSDEKINYPTEKEVFYSIEISRKFFNTLRTLPEKKQLNYLVKNIIAPIFKELDLNSEEISYAILVPRSDSNHYLTWFASENF